MPNSKDSSEIPGEVRQFPTTTVFEPEGRLKLEPNIESVPLVGDLICPVVVQPTQDGTALLAEGNTLLHAPEKRVLDYIFKKMADDTVTLKKMRLAKHENVTKILFQGKATSISPATTIFFITRHVEGHAYRCLLQFQENQVDEEKALNEVGKVYRRITMKSLKTPRSEFLPDYNRAMAVDPKIINYTPIDSIFGQIEISNGEISNTSDCRMIFRAASTSIAKVSLKTVQALAIKSSMTSLSAKAKGYRIDDEEPSMFDAAYATAPASGSKRTSSAASVKSRRSSIRQSLRSSMKGISSLGSSDSPEGSNKLASDTLRVLFRFIFQLFLRFERSDEIDSIARRETIQNVRKIRVRPDCPEENFAITPLKKLTEGKKWTRNAGSANKEFDLYTSKSNSGCWLKQSARIDTSCEEVFAHLYNLDSYVRRKAHIQLNPMLPYFVRTLEGSRGKELTFATKSRGPAKMFETWVTWTKEEAPEGDEERKAQIARIGPKFFVAMNPLKLYDEFREGRHLEAALHPKENATSKPTGTQVRKRRAKTRFDKFIAFPGGFRDAPNDDERASEGTISSGKDSSGPSGGMVEGKLKSLVTIEPLAPNVCKVTYTLNIDFDTSVSNSSTMKCASQILGSFISMKKYFERNGKQVDFEVAQELTLRMTNKRHSMYRSIVQHEEEQTALIDRVYELQEKVGRAELWKTVDPYDIFRSVNDPSLELRIMDTENDKKNTCARMKGAIHCPAELAAAAFFDSESYFRKTMHLENVARDSSARNTVLSTSKLLKRISACDQVVGSIISFPNPMWPRETIFRQVLGKGADDEYFIAMESTEGEGGEEDVDFGLTTIQKSKITKVKGKALLVFHPDENYNDRCSFTWLMDCDLDISRKNLFFKDYELVFKMMGEFFCLKNFFDRAKEVELEDIDLYAEHLRNFVGVEHTRKEKKVITTVTKNFQRALQSVGGFQEYPHNGDQHVTIETCWLENDKNIVAKATCFVDANIFQCAAWEINKNREIMIRNGYNKATLRRQIIPDGPHGFIYYVVYRFGKFVHKRDALAHAAWRCEGNDAEDGMSTLILCYADNEEFERTGMGANKRVDLYDSDSMIRAETWSLWKFESIKGGVQTKVTRVTQANMRGFIPHGLINAEIKSHMLFQSALRKLYDKSEMLDRKNRLLTMDTMKNVHSGSYTEAEAVLVKNLINMFKVFHQNRNKNTMRDAKIPGTGCR
eukprot:CAMPEP_0118642472 /NCGR_PEP_ID=MMETSP0785-20121206/5851_1 /TAXON_ID=91992 /ORGANISM="Bolidomonas pacifica, Strain CCMP 1866" /LENGTH=1212 /DNA_ID=CAMNT_0006534021 /DNA_START=187 /DNA_END=3822 /DNA_ORIENTATION=-